MAGVRPSLLVLQAGQDQRDNRHLDPRCSSLLDAAKRLLLRDVRHLLIECIA